LTIDRADKSVAILDLPPELPPRTIAMVYPRDAPLSAAALRFKEIALPLCKDILARMAQPAVNPPEDVHAGASLGRRGKLSAV
jgi:hypothetical protein